MEAKVAPVIRVMDYGHACRDIRAAISRVIAWNREAVQVHVGGYNLLTRGSFDPRRRLRVRHSCGDAVYEVLDLAAQSAGYDGPLGHHASYTPPAGIAREAIKA
jgi:hypothetical protein